MTQNVSNFIIPEPLSLNGTRNTRELGGYRTLHGSKTRTHAFLRSDSLSELTDTDIQTLLRYGVRCVVDMRSETELTASPSAMKHVEDIYYYSVPILDEIASKGYIGQMPDRMGKIYIELLSRNQKDFAIIMRIFARHNDCTVLFNCMAGKDRTGIIAMLLLLLAGVPHEVMIADYSVSETNMKELFQKQKVWLQKKYGIAVPDHIFSSKPEEIEMALQYLLDNYGTAQDYLLHCGVSVEDLCTIRNMLVSE
jgi:protein-tyrosine phosphatase